MRRTLFFALSLFCSLHVFAQAYIPMPTDSATWRSRTYDIDFETQVFDIMLYQNGQDTFLNGNTYFQVMSRVAITTVANGTNVPVTDFRATSPDSYYCGIREQGKKVYGSTLNSERLIYDFNAVVGDSIPAFQGNVLVTAIDSVLLGGVYHKRYLTTDATFYVIEGVGSSVGLFPYINGDESISVFYCFNHDSTSFSPDSTQTCTYITSWDSPTSVANVKPGNVLVYPVPANDVLTINGNGIAAIKAVICDQLGRSVWQGSIGSKTEINVASWAGGIYYLQMPGLATKKILVIH